MKRIKKKGGGSPKSIPKAKDSKPVPSILVCLLVAAGIVLFVGAGMYFTFQTATSKAPSATICTPVSFDNFKLLVQRAGFSEILMQNVSSYAAQGKFVKIYQVTINVNGQIACGYLYIRARIGDQPLNDAYDSIYITCQDSGGHLMRLQSLAITEPVAGTTEVLFPLDAIPFVPHVPYNPATTQFKYADWVKILNAKNKARFWVGLSTLNPAGKIEEAKIVYILVPGTKH